MGQLAGQAIASHVIEPQVVLGADPDYADSDGETALHKAAQWSHAAVAMLLIARGIDANILDSVGHASSCQCCMSCTVPPHLLSPVCQDKRPALSYADAELKDAIFGNAIV